MNQFKESLKYNQTDISKNTSEPQNNLLKKIKKAAMIGSLSVMAAVSSVSCSKSDGSTRANITEHQNLDNPSETNLSQNDKAREQLLEDIQEQINKIENYPDNKLSDEDSLKIENLLYQYVFLETSDNYGENIPYTSIIPNKDHAQLSGTFSVTDDQKKSIRNYYQYEDKGLLLDADSTQLFNEYVSNILGTASLSNTLSTLYKVELNLCKENEQLIDNLSYEDTVNLMKSSYISAYNNMLEANNSYNSVETKDASDFIVYVNKDTDGEYSLSSYILNDNGDHTLFETTLDTQSVKVLDDYLDAYSAFYDDSTNVETILTNLKIANDENQVSEDELIEQLTNISLHHEKFDKYLAKTGLHQNVSEQSQEER